MKVRIESRDECLGDAICCDECPEVFVLSDEDGLVTVINENPDDSLADAVRNAADECPAEIIIIEE